MKRAKASAKTVNLFDVTSWNFIIFLLLAFVLIIIVALAMGNQAEDLRARAGLGCKKVRELPSPEQCPDSVWEYQRSQNGCVQFVCPTTSQVYP